MTEKRIPLYDRLPEIYRIRDEEQIPKGQLRAFLELVESVFGYLHENIDSLYDDLFIETCDDWVIPYIGDLLGTSHLSGPPWTLRADVADTIAMRRRKGTIGAIELLTYNLTQWGVHCAELRENLVWNQHLNHQRPDGGGRPPYAAPSPEAPDRSVPSIYTVIRGGTATLRDPAMLSLLNSPFDPFAHTANLKPEACTTLQYNLPNLAIFLWRLEAYRVKGSLPVCDGPDNGHPPDPTMDLNVYPDTAPRIARFHIHPLGEPVRLFNTHRFDPDRKPAVITRVDQVPGPIPTPRLSDDSEAGNPEAYVAVDPYNPDDPLMESVDISEVGLIFHIPLPDFMADSWIFRGVDLCAWENNIYPPLRFREIAIDPVLGRVIFGVGSEDEARALTYGLLVTYTYGAVGPVGAHPRSRPSPPETFGGTPVKKIIVDVAVDPAFDLDLALKDIGDKTEAIIIEINDSYTHDLDIGTVSGIKTEQGAPSLQLNHSLIIRAADGCRPIIRLDRPLRFRTKNVMTIDSELMYPTVRLEGIYVTNKDPSEALISRAALNRLEIMDCTLDPGGFRLNDTRAPIRTAIALSEDYGFDSAVEEEKFDQTPEIFLQRTISGPLRIAVGYDLILSDSIVDAGSGVSDDPADAGFAISGPGVDPSVVWGPPTRLDGLTVFGRTRVEKISGSGGIFVHSIEARNNQTGCIKFSYLPNIFDSPPQLHASVFGTEVLLRFVSEEFGNPAYGQLALSCDVRIREDGPFSSELDFIPEGFSGTGDTGYTIIEENNRMFKAGDQMGAYGFLLEVHKWRNIQIRYREFMPVGVRPLLIPVT